ncbi:MAG: RsiV family protein [Lachnospiraceae bacterium]|nr:RsiV family protein [Lachnospiraceae bacterium]
MQNREKELSEIKSEYMTNNMPEESVKKMKESIEKAKSENRREYKHSMIKVSLAAVAAILVIITILPNTSANVAYAMSRIPIISKWVDVVTFRDYQYSDDRNTADITVPEIVPQDIDETAAETVPQPTDEKENIKKTADEINAEIKEITEKLIQEFEENLQYEEGYQEMIVKSEILATTDQYFTLKLICYQGAGSGAEWDYFYTIDLESGERLKLSDLFKEGSDYIGVISENIKKQMREQMAADEMVYYWLESDIPDWNFDKITDDTNFYLNQDGNIVIAFNEGDVAPMYMGCVEFVIPKEIVAGIM